MYTYAILIENSFPSEAKYIVFIYMTGFEAVDAKKEYNK